ncbi:MAG: FtsX-like permease family protein, partial [Bacteroidales bacterium]|nr:FtsX-like permease family protein [Bacteroidales bacterium]
SFAISESIAEKFDLEIGMTLGYEGYANLRTIKAIFKDLPENSHFADVKVLRNLGDDGITNFSEWGYHYFIKVYDPSQIKDMEESLASVSREYLMKDYFGNFPSAEELGMTQEAMDEAISNFLTMAEVQFMPLEGLYYASNISTPIERGSKTTTIILIIVALLIVCIAFINYINFFFAQIPERIRAVNTKKVLGCTRRELIISTVTESVTLILFALALAFAFVMLFNKSQLTHLISADSAFSANVGVSVLTVIIAVIIAVVSSLYPAFYITSFEPALVLKGSFSGTKTGQRLRYTLIGLQFVISLILIICSSFIIIQRRYMVDFDMGFDKEQLLFVHTTEYIGQNAETVEEQLKANPQILDVSWAAGNLLASTRMGWGRDFNGTVVNFQCYAVSSDFPEFMGIKITEGRSFRKEDENNPNGTFIFNEEARRTYGFTLEDRVSGHADLDAAIVGFCDDFSFKTLKEEVTPFALYVFGSEPWWHPSTAFIRVAAGADYNEVKKHIGKVLSEWRYEFSPDEWEIYFFDENINWTYRKEESLSQLISLFTLVAIIISLMGVFGLVMFETQYRRREIALRRVNGATVRDILEMFSSRFVKIVLVCFAVAAPISWVIVDRYLATFAHRCPMYWWVFALALIAVLAITIGVVVVRSWKAATADPANALKTE